MTQRLRAITFFDDELNRIEISRAIGDIPG